MEVGPTTHYVMGGVRVVAETGATTVDGLFAAGEVSRRDARREPARRQLAVRPARVRRSGRAPARRPTPRRSRTIRRTWTRSRSPARAASSTRRSSARTARTPTRSSATSRTMMQRLVGIFRAEADLDEALVALGELRARWREHQGVRRPRVQPGLEPRLRAAQPAHRVGGDHPQRPQPQGEPGRAQPPRFPRPGRRHWGEPQRGHPPRRGRGDEAPARPRFPRCPPSCASCSAAPLMTERPHA